MIAEGFKGYVEGADPTQISKEYLTYPSKNCLTYKGKVITRAGIKNDGNAATGSEKIHSEYVWKNAPGGAKYIRCFGTSMQIKIVGLWITIFDGFTEGTTRVRFAPWTDTNGSIIKSRLFMVDGSDKIFEWCGGVATVESIATATISISDEKTFLQLGFDPYDAANIDVQIVHFVSGAVDDISAYVHADSLADNEMTLTATPDPTPVAGDLVVASVITHTDQLTGFNKDEIYPYKNHLFVANLESGRIYYSHATDYLTFTIPGTKTAITADLLDLDGNFRAMISRKNVLWISTTDDWFKVTKTVEVNAYGYWTNVEKFEQAERTGARAFAVAIQKGDVIFMAEDKTLRKITSLEIIGTDDIQLISDGIDGLLLRLELEDVRLYYHQRYVFIISGGDGIMLMLDTIQNEFQPPQYLPINCMSIIEGVRYGHSNARDESFELFTGRNDLGTQIEAVIAPGYVSGHHQFRYKKHTIFGLHGRGTITTKCKIEHFYEEAGAKDKKEANFTVGDIKVYEVPDDVSFGANPLATRSLAGIDDFSDASLKPFFIFDKWENLSWFNYRPTFTITGEEVEFHLIGWYIDEMLSERKIGNDLFIQKEAEEE
jgi:hypothetical protein